MESPQQANNKKSLFRRKSVWFSLVLTTLVLGIVWLAQSDFLMNQIKKIAEKQVSEQLDASLKIKNMRGNVFSHLVIEELSLFDEQEKILGLDTLSVSYSLFSLLQSEFNIKELRISKPTLNLRQTSFDSWNVLDILPPSEPGEVEDSEGDSEFPFPFRISSFTIEKGSLNVHSPQFLPDTTLAVRDLNIAAGFAMLKDDMELELADLRLNIIEGRFEHPLFVQAGVDYKKGRFSLNEFLFESGASLLRSSAFFDENDDSVEADLRIKPLSHKELAAYIEELPLRQDLDIILKIGGSLQDLRAGLQVNADDLQNFELQTRFAVFPDFELKSFQTSIDKIALSELTGIDDLPIISGLNFSGTGNMNPAYLAEAIFELHGKISHIDVNTWEIKDVILDAHLDIDRLVSNIEWSSDSQNFSISANASEIFQEESDWTSKIEIRNFNPGYWARDENLSGSMAILAEISGRGFDPEIAQVAYNVILEDVRLPMQSFSRLEAEGIAGLDKISSDVKLTIEDSELIASLNLNLEDEEPRYEFGVFTEQFNLAEIQGLDALPTRLRFYLEGEGKGFDPETIQLQANFDADSSFVNRAFIPSFGSDFRLNGPNLIIQDARLISDIADAQLKVNFKLDEPYHPENFADFSLDIKDVSPFSNLAGLERLFVLGNITGTARAEENERLGINAELALREIEADTIAVSQIDGSFQANISEKINYSLEIKISEPGTPAFTAHSVTINSEGKLDGNLHTNSFDFEFLVREGSGIAQKAEVRIAQDILEVFTTHLSIFDPVGGYELMEPFLFEQKDSKIRLDTLRLSSNNSSKITLAIEQYGEESFRGMFDGQDADLGLIQQVVMDEAMFDAFLSGRIAFDIRGLEHINLDSDIIVHSFKMDEIALDTLQLRATIIEEWLDLNFAVRKDQKEYIAASYTLPFQPEAPEDLDAEFFEQEVMGSLHIPDFDLQEFTPVLAMLGLEGLTGRLQANSTLSGTAGSPNLTGEFILYGARISDVPVDSLDLRMDYSHEENQINLVGFMNSLDQRVLEISGDIPLFIDFQSFDISGPDQDNPLDVSFVSNEFRLATLNDFIPRDVARGLRGSLQADINVKGPPEKLEALGYARLRNGSVRVIENNIRFQNMRMDLLFEPDKITIEQLSMDSGGSLSASGEISLDGFMPSDIQLRANARNFRVYDTRDIDLFISLNTDLRGPLESLQLSGDLTMERGVIYLDNFGERTIEDVKLEDEESTTTEMFDFFTPMQMEMGIVFTRNFFLRNRRDPELNLDLRGELDLVKNPGDEDVEIFGELEIPTGHATTLFNKRFEMDSGSILFSGPATNPEMNIRTVYRPRQTGEDIRIFYVISGTVEEPEFSYESDPEMGFQDIVSYTLFGRPFAALAGWERSVSGRSQSDFAADIAIDLIIDRIEQLAADRLGIDVVEIDNNQKGTGSGTSIKAGKYVTDRLFIAYVQELGGTNLGRQVLIEYMLRNNLDLLITASDDYRTGVDILWRYDY